MSSMQILTIYIYIIIHANVDYFYGYCYKRFDHLKHTIYIKSATPIETLFVKSINWNMHGVYIYFKKYEFCVNACKILIIWVACKLLTIYIHIISHVNFDNFYRYCHKRFDHLNILLTCMFL